MKALKAINDGIQLKLHVCVYIVYTHLVKLVIEVVMHSTLILLSHFLRCHLGERKTRVKCSDLLFSSSQIRRR